MSKKIKANKKAENEKLDDEKLDDEKLDDEKPVEKISVDQLKTLNQSIEKLASDLNLSVTQSIDHISLYRLASDLLTNANIKFDEIAGDSLKPDQASFNTVQSWFNRLDYEQMMADKSIYTSQKAIVQASFKISNTSQLVKSHIAGMTFNDTEKIDQIDGLRLLLQASLFLSSSRSGNTGKVSNTDTDNRNPDTFTGDRLKLHDLIKSTSAVNGVKHIDFNTLKASFESVQVGRATFEASISKMSTLYKKSNTGTMSINKIAGTVIIEMAA